MTKHWSATCLVLALLGCLAGTKVEAQDPVWQKPMSKGSPPPQASQVLPPPPPPPQAPQYPQAPQVPRPSLQKAPQVPQVQRPPKAPQYPEAPQVFPPQPQFSLYSQLPQVQRPSLQKTPQNPQVPQVQQPPKAPQYPEAPQVFPPQPQFSLYSQLPQVQRPSLQKTPQNPQVPQVQQPPKASQYPEAPQVSPPQPQFSLYSQLPQVQRPSLQKTPQNPQVPQVQRPPKAPQYPEVQQLSPPQPQFSQYSQTTQGRLPPPKVPQNHQVPQVQQPPKAPQYPEAPQVFPPQPQFPLYPQPPQVQRLSLQKTPQNPQVPQVQRPPKAPQYPEVQEVSPPQLQFSQYSQTTQGRLPPPKAPQNPQVPQVQPPPKAPQYPQASQVFQPRPKFPQYPQMPQVQQPPLQKAPQNPQVPQVQPPPQQKAIPRPQTPQILPPPSPQRYPKNPQMYPRGYPPQDPYDPELHQPYQPLGQQEQQEPKGPHQPYQPQQPHQPTSPQASSIYQPGASKEPSFQSCEVAVSQRVPCGGSDISAAACEAISCCFDGQQCYFGKAVTVQCTKDAQFIVVVARDATLPNIDLESVSLLGQGQGCTHVESNSAFAIYQFPVTACGSVVMEEPGVIIYENRMFSSYEVAVGDLGTITRDSYYELLFQCRYTGTSVETIAVEVLPLLDPPLPVAALGPIRVHLRLANGQCNTKGCNEVDVAYSSFYTEADYPVTKVLRDPVYVEVQLIEKTDPNLVLTVGRCWTTMSPNPHNLPQWDILIDGCPYRDDRYLSSLIPVGPSSGLDFPSHYRRFMFKMFTFVNPSSMEPMNEQVYIHCSTAVCSAASGRNCEPSCFRKKRDVRAAEKKTAEPKVVVSVGPVIIGSPQEETASSKLENLADNI